MRPLLNRKSGAIGARAIGSSVALLVLLSAVCDASELDGNLSRTPPNATMRCGPNAVFLFLGACGRTGIAIEDFDRLALTSEGTSLLAMRDAAKGQSVDCEIRRYQADEIAELPLPAIGQFHATADLPTRFHYMLFYKVDSQRAYVVDATTGGKHDILRSELATLWTGVALVPKRSFGEVLSTAVLKVPFKRGLLAIDVLFFGWLGAAALRRYVARKAKSLKLAVPSYVASTIALPLALVLPSPMGISAAESAPEPWRCAANGGRNALYCYLRVHGVECDYSTLLAQDAANTEESATSLVRLAAQQGMALTPVTLTLDELSQVSLPVLVHMDGQTPEAGAFLLVFGLNGEVFYYVNGPTASVHSMSREDFRRVWSGVALLPRPSRWRKFVSACAGLVVGAFGNLIVFRLGIRFRGGVRP